MEKYYYVYMMTNKTHSTVYTGVTSNLPHRVWQHKNKMIDGFTKTYNCTKLVYMESYKEVKDAIKREKNIKAWKRDWKDQAIQKMNPNWNDLFESLNR